MYRSVFYNQQEECMHLYTWDTDGNRVVTKCSYNPYMYTETKLKGAGKTLFGTNVKKHSFKNQYERSKYIKNLSTSRVFENINCDQQFLIDQFWKEHEKPEFTQHKLRIFYLDIETYSPGEFPVPEIAKDEINVITIYDTLSEKFYTWGTKKTTKNIDNCIYKYCETEKILLESFLGYLQLNYPDIITGWNSEFFDIPYLINRTSRVLGEMEIEKFSPERNVYKRSLTGLFGKEQIKWYISGISCVDYLDVYKKFSVGLRPSYKLDAIAELEVGEKKVDYGNTNLSSLADDDWQTFVEYNVQDVNLLLRMEDKLRYLELLRMLAYVGLTSIQSAMGTLSVITGAIVIKGRQNELIIPTFVKYRDSEAQKYEGAYVGEPKRGFQESIISFDANSLYPNTMITLNLSPETKIGKITNKTKTHVTIQTVNGRVFDLTLDNFMKFVEKEKISISKAKILFTQLKKGIVPEIVDKIYQNRVEIKKELNKIKRQLSTNPDNKQLKAEADRLDIKQFTLKILINTVYGYFGNKHAPVGDPDIARSITLTGQAVIKQSNKILTEYIQAHPSCDDRDFNPIIYNDTDSSYITIKTLCSTTNQFSINNKITKHGYKVASEIEDHLNIEIDKWSRKSLNSTDSRFIFKRECMCDTGTFLQKKRYVIHVLDDEGFPVDKFKYTGVEVVRTTMPDNIKPYVKQIIETMLTTRDRSKTNKIFMEAYEIFKKLPIEDFAFVMGISNYDKYADKCDEFKIGKGVPIHVKSAYYYNLLLHKHELSDQYEQINNGDKIRYYYTQQPNKYGIPVMGYKYYLPEELRTVLQPDIELMFNKIVFNVIERFYDSVNWRLERPGRQVQTDLFDLLS